MRLSYTILISTLLLLLLISIASPAEDSDVLTYTITQPIDDAQPVITVSFGEKNIVWVEHELFYESAALEDQPLPKLNQQSFNEQNNEWKFSTPPTSYLFNADYRFYAQARDSDENTITVNVLFTIETDEQPIYLVNPNNSYFPTTSTFAMNNDSQFNFSVRVAERPVKNCRWVFSSSFAGDVNMESCLLYSNLGANSEFETHSNDNMTFSIDNFNMNYQTEGQLHAITIVCQELNGECSKAPLAIGYDRTPPTITFTADPEIIIDPNAPWTDVNVTTDDPSFCTFTNPNYPQPGNGVNYKYTAFLDREVLSSQSYDTNMSEQFFFTAINNHPIASEEQQTYTFNVTCENIAGDTSWATKNVTINYDPELIITIKSPKRYSSGGSIQYEFNTNFISVCSLTIDEEEIVLSTTDDKTFTGSKSDKAGNHEYTINCQSVGGYSDSITRELIIDDTAPEKVNITNYDTLLCGGDEISVDFEAEDDVSGIDYYHYVIKQNNDVLVDDNTTRESVNGYTINGNNNDQFIVTINAVDEAGNVGRPSSTAPIIYKDITDPVCDETAPTTSASTRPGPGGEGLEVNITCSDTHSGCDTTGTIYSYTITPNLNCDPTNSSKYADRSKRINTPFIITENVKFCWYVEDRAQPTPNKGFGSTSVTGNLGINVIKPRFGISPNKTFTLTINTAETANCLQGEYLDTYDGRTSRQLYNTLEGRANSDFDTTGGSTHTINNFNGTEGTGNERTIDWVVACASTNEELYGSQKITLGYDLTPPEIDVTFTPTNPIIEPSIDEATITITTDDDSLCTYLQPTINPYSEPAFRYNFNAPESNQHYDLLNRLHYDTSFTTRLPENDEWYLYTAAYTDYPYQIRCTNLAGRNTTETHDLIVDHLNNLAVTIGTPREINTKRVLINATTILQSDCTYSIDSVEAQPLTSTDNYYHYNQVTLADSSEKYHLVIQCESTESNQLSGSASSTIRVDSEPPTQTNITTIGVTCGLNEEPEVRFDAEDEGTSIDYYEYTLTTGTNTTTHLPSSNRINLPVNTPLKDGTTYSIKARAYDNAGNIGPWSQTTTITATDDDDVLCDEDNPTGWYERKDTATGADIIIHCTDQGSGCAQTYEYALINAGENCTEAYYQTSTSGITGNTYDARVTVTEDKLVCWRVKDVANNQFTPEEPIDITVSLDIDLTTPTFGISNSQTFDLTYETSSAADCKLGFLNPNHPTTLKEWYGQLTIPFDTTGFSLHTINDFNIVDAGASACSGREECTQALVIICTENNRYHYAVHQVGFDTSPPSLTTRAEPNPVREPGNLQATLYAESDDDVWCRYVRDDGESYAFTTNPDPDNRGNYQEEQQQFLGYFSAPEDGTTEYAVDYEVTCVNLGGDETTQTVNLVIAPTNNIGITINTPSQHETRGVTLDITTDLAANCKYTFNPNQPSRAFSTTGGTTHTASQLFPTDDEYEMTVFCEAISGPYEAQATKTFTVDATGPKMLEIITQSSTCSLSEIEAVLVSNATIIGLDSYNYSITDSKGDTLIDWQTVSANGNHHINENLDLTIGEQYNIQAQAIDNFGRKSSIIATTVEAQDEKYATCDEEPPIASLTIEEVYGGVEAYVNCEDDGTGCTDTYGFEHAKGSCNDTYTSYWYSNRPIELTSSGRACALVYDKAGHNDTISESFTIIDYCSNGIEDPEEDGEDCGGPCPASCNTCNNGRQDLDEAGTDCGGVCPQSCEQDCGNNIVESGEECDGSIPSSITCQSLHFKSGSLSCTDTCEIQTADCVPTTTAVCGNDVVEVGEECDGPIGGLTCEDYGLTSGSLTCSGCEISTSNCDGIEGHCGDGFIGPGESCDEEFQGLTCESFGLISGELDCNECDINTDDCFNGYCGDGEIDQGESCDGLNWGDITSCTDISDDFIDGMPVCGGDCHFNTNECVQNPEPGDKQKFCLKDSDCDVGKECKNNACTQKQTITPPGDDSCSNDGDCLYGYECVLGTCTPGDVPLTPPAKHGLGIALLSAGILSLLGGAGYLVYTTFINPPPAPTMPAPGTTGSPTKPITPTESPAQRAARIEAERKKLNLQQQAKKKAQDAKSKQRKALLSSFEGDKLAEKRKPVKKPSIKGEQKTIEKKTVKKSTKKLTKPEQDDVFKELESITKRDVQKGVAKSTEDVFDDLATLSGSSKNKLKTTINKNNTTTDELVKLFEGAERKDVTPKRLTPMFKHFIDKGKLEHSTVHETIHKLHEQEKLTHLQKEKILKDLEIIGERK